MRVLVLINAAAGAVASARDQDQAARIRAAFAAEAIDADVRLVPGPDLSSTTRQALTEHYDILIAAGGDGTINTVAAELINTPQPFAILPVGTMNHLAKELNMPLDLEPAVRAIAHGTITDFNVGQVNDRIFLSFSALGVYSHIIKHRDTQRQVLGRKKWPAMLVAALKVFRWFPLFHVRLQFNADTLHRITPLVFITLNEYQQRMFGVENFACQGRHALSLYITSAPNRLRLLWLLLRGTLGLLRPSADFQALCVSNLTLHTHRRHIRVALDGEVLDLPSPLHYRLLPHALRIVVPRP